MQTKQNMVDKGSEFLVMARKRMTQKCIQHIMNGNLLSVKDLLEA